VNAADLHHRRDAHAAAKPARALLAGTLIVLVLYVALNAVFLHTTPIDKLSGQLDVARIAGSHIFGEIGRPRRRCDDCIGLVSSISAMMWIGPRVMMTMGRTCLALRVFARKSALARRSMRSCSSSRSQPCCCSPAVSRPYSISSSSPLLFCSFFTVLGVIKLRIHAARAAAALSRLGLPGNACGFLLVTVFMMYYLLTERPLQSLLGTLMMISGLLIYAIFRKRADPGSAIARQAPNNVLQPIKMAAVAAAMLFAATALARAADTVTADDTARFLAGMPPSRIRR